MTSFITSNLRTICYISMLTCIPSIALVLTYFCYLCRYNFVLFNLEYDIEEKMNSNISPLLISQDLLKKHYILKTKILQTNYRTYVFAIVTCHLLSIAGCFISIYNLHVTFGIFILWTIIRYFVLTEKYKLKKESIESKQFLNIISNNILYKINKEQDASISVISKQHLYLRKKSILFLELVCNIGIFITCLIYLFIHKAI